jgi:hypothetical protein
VVAKHGCPATSMGRKKSQTRFPMGPPFFSAKGASDRTEGAIRGAALGIVSAMLVGALGRYRIALLSWYLGTIDSCKPTFYHCVSRTEASCNS